MTSLEFLVIGLGVMICLLGINIEILDREIANEHEKIEKLVDEVAKYRPEIKR